MKLRLLIPRFSAIILIAFSCQTDEEITHEAIKEKRNIILLIGDGLGTPSIQAAMIVSRYPLNLERCNIIGYQRTSSSDNVITDSGAAATAIATGIKTRNGSIAVDSSGNSVKTILEIAEQNGLATGLISTSSITHATPAAFIAHQAKRSDVEDIAMDFLSTDIDLFIGGGYDNFAKRSDNLNLIDSLKIRGYEVDTTMENVVNSLSDKIAGLVAPVHNPFRSDGRGDMLLLSTLKALELLDKDEDGFFLMIEGSQIDWAAHSNNSDILIDEILDFDKAVGLALDFARIDGQTLVIITADHETGGVSIIGGDINNHKVTLSFSTTGHTGNMVPVFAYGPEAEQFRGFYENTDIFYKMLKAFGFAF